MNKIGLVIFIFSFFNISFLAAQEIKGENGPTLEFHAYTDVYYSKFTNEIGPNELQPFTTVSPRNERFGLNVAQTGLSYEAERLRSNFTLHYGDISQATWSQEFPNVQEANLGFRITGDWWIDAGFFTTHIGTESFLPKNGFLSSTAVATYNEPFYQAGAKVSYEGSGKFYAEFWMVNGYNRFLDVNNAKSVGLLFSYFLNENSSITYTNLFGRESPDAAFPSQFRTYNNLYFNSEFDEKIFLTIGADMGTQTNSEITDPSGTAVMYNALATLRYQFEEKYSLTTRLELFNDRHGFISGLLPVSNGVDQGLQLWGITFGGEYKPASNAYIRTETRFLKVDENTPLFSGNKDPFRRWEIMVTMGYQLKKLFHL